MRAYFLYDGYRFGERLLEGVMFRCYLNEDQTEVVDVAIDPKSDGKYWEGLNQTKWLEMCKECAAEEYSEEFDLRYES